MAHSVTAQTLAPGLTPNVDLTATLDGGPARAAALRFDPAKRVISLPLARAATADDGKLFHDEPEPEGGWKGLARLLEALTPSVDTSVPLTPSQITDRISRMLDQGQDQAALDIIQKRKVQRQAEGALGQDVQLMFLEGRALSGLGRHTEAIALYLDMTTTYPELPEPWNNLAAEYVRQGKLDMALDALQMALTADPHYATALANLGEVRLMLARESFQEAARYGAGPAAAKAERTAEILQK